MKSNVKKLNIIYLLSFFGDALFSPFLALFYKSINLNEFQIGILLALIPASSLLGNYFYGKISSTVCRNLKICRIMAMINCLVMLPFGFVTNYPFIIVLTIIFSLHNNSFFSIQDGLAVEYCEKEKKTYAFTRMFGSIGYFIALLLNGVLTVKLAYRYIFMIAAIIYVFVTILLFLLTPIEMNTQEKIDINYKSLFTNKLFIKYLIFYFLVLGIWSVGEAYCSLYFNSLGMDSSIWSYIYATQVGVEIITIFASNKLINNEKAIKYILLISCCLMAIRYFCLSFDYPYLIKAIISSIMRGLAWGLLISSHMNLVKSILGVDLATKGVTLLSMEGNIFAAIGNFVCPYIITNTSYFVLYLILSLIQVGGIGVYINIIISLRKQNKTINYEKQK